MAVVKNVNCVIFKVRFMLCLDITFHVVCNIAVCECKMLFYALY